MSLRERINNLWNSFIADKEISPDTKVALQEITELISDLAYKIQQLQPKSRGDDGLW